MVQVYSVGNVQNGNANAQKDAMSVTSTITSTASFRSAMSNPVERDAFTRGVDARLEMALATGDKTMYDVLSALKGKIKNYAMPNQDIYSSDNGFSAIG